MHIQVWKPVRMRLDGLDSPSTSIWRLGNGVCSLLVEAGPVRAFCPELR